MKASFISAMLAAQSECAHGNHDAALQWLHTAARLSWSVCPQANPQIARAIWQLECAGPGPRKIA